MIGDDGDSVQALAGVAPVTFELADDSIIGFSIEDSDCYTDTADM